MLFAALTVALMQQVQKLSDTLSANWQIWLSNMLYYVSVDLCICLERKGFAVVVM